MAPNANALQPNFDVDYVITYRFTDTSRSFSLMLKKDA